MKVFLDIDGVLLGTDRERPTRLALADHAATFLQYATRQFDCYWLAAQCRGSAASAVDHIVRHAKMSDRESVMRSAAKIRATSYRELRTEALPADGDFVWFDDGPDPAELAVLRERGWMNCWQWVDTREEPEDLLRAMEWLRARVQVGRARGGRA
ncbi:MAG: hypothetical protein AB8H80_18485 [Planctomycetota bacterium]